MVSAENEHTVLITGSVCMFVSGSQTGDSGNLWI